MADVVILSSDEEDKDERETGSLFQEFLTKVKPFVHSNVVVLLSVKFDEARTDFVSSSSFRTLLQRKTGVVGNEDAYIHTGEICRALCENTRKDPPKPETCKPTVSSSSDVKVVIECNGDSSRPRVTTDAGEFENDNTIEPTASGGDKISPSTVQDIDDDIVIVEIPGKPSFPQYKPTCSGKLNAKSSNPKKVLSPTKRKKVIRRLEEKMKLVSEQIQILNRAELSLDEMGMSDSTYIKECRLKERFNKIWNKICTLQGKPPNTGRVTEKEVKCPTTGYPVIDEEVHKLMKNRKSFPDIFDVKELINKTNRKHDLRISAVVLQELAEEVFTNIGNKLQRRRKIDFDHNFGCFLTDDYQSERDPALHDPNLQRKLHKNHKKSKHALNKVFMKFVHYNRQKFREGRDGQSPAYSQEDSSDDSVGDDRQRCRGRVMKNTDSCSSSGGSESEPNEDSSQPSQTKGSDSDKMQIHQGRTTRNANHSLSDASDSEDNVSFLHPHTKNTKQYVDGSDKPIQETAPSSRPKPCIATFSARKVPASTTNGSESPKSKYQKVSKEDTCTCNPNSIKDSRSSAQSTTNGSGTSSSKSQEVLEGDCDRNGIKESEGQAVITIIDDADVQEKRESESENAVPRSQEPVKTNSNGVPSQANGPASEGKIIQECVGSSHSPVDIEQSDSVKQPDVVGEKTTGGTNDEVSLQPNSSSSGPEIKVSSATAKVCSPLNCSVNLKPVSFPKELTYKLSLPKAKKVQHQKVGNGKRPAEDHLMIYESPLKLFRKSTLSLLQSERVSGKQIVQPATYQNESVNGLLSSKVDERTSISEGSGEPTDENSPIRGCRNTPKKSLSLKKKHLKKNKEVSNHTQAAIIVLSDDDSD